MAETLHFLFPSPFDRNNRRPSSRHRVQKYGQVGVLQKSALGVPLLDMAFLLLEQRFVSF
jgi:hypothetical protein